MSSSQLASSCDPSCISLLSSTSFPKQPKMVALSNVVAFANPNAPVYPRLAQGKTWDEVSLKPLLFVVFLVLRNYTLVGVCVIGNFSDFVWEIEFVAIKYTTRNDSISFSFLLDNLSFFFPFLSFSSFFFLFWVKFLALDRS